MDFEQLGPYRLKKKLGQGGMGAVYEGVDVDTAQPAAIKVLNPALASEEGFRVRFEAEIESLKKLRHPNIVRLFGYGEQGGTLFYSMELVPGTSLEDELRAARRFDWREVTQIGIRLCRALKHAHDHGVIHRDLKPANLLLTPEGEIKLSDFGIARLFGNAHLTSDGGVLGTAEYMAPEQAEGRMVTDRCDQYSLGGVLYALLAGRPPFRAKSLVEMLQLQRYAIPEPLNRLAPQTPAELSRIVHQLLEKDPQKRFANALIVARSLEAMERGLSILPTGDDDFVLTHPGSPTLGDKEVSQLGATLSPTQIAGQPPVAPPAVVAGSVAKSAAQLSPQSRASSSAAAPLESEREDDDRGTLAGRFTKVEEQQRPSELREAISSLLSGPTLALALGLLVVIAGGWYLLRPASADRLFSQIEAETADGDAVRMRAIAPKISEFLERFPDDPRAEELRELADEARQVSPVQRLYSEAMRYSLINPELAASKLQSLIDVYDEGDDMPETTRHYVRLARTQQKRLQKQIAKYADEGRTLIAARLSKAAEIAPADPAAAEKIYRGIIALYREKSWAEDLVAQAQAKLDATDAATAAARAEK